MTIAVSGRRIDAADARSERFPLRMIPAVQERVRQILIEKNARTVVASAASGADLVALSVAKELGLRRRIILPFDKERFLKTSVADRPGDWEPRYRELVNEAEQSGELVITAPAKSDDAAYELAVQMILDAADAAGEPCGALLIWEGAPRGPQDMTALFKAGVERRGWPIFEVISSGVREKSGEIQG